MEQPIGNHFSVLPDHFQQMVDDYFSVRYRYEAALKEVQTKLEIMDAEFQVHHARNPIHHLHSRLKSTQSIWNKLKRKNIIPSLTAAVDNIFDIAGMRVVCSYVEDVYYVARMLASQDDVHVMQVKDYIKHPKSNGYRSLHMIIEIPIFLSTGKENIPVEVQIRTIAMDLWASLEHHLRYKEASALPQEVEMDLASTAADLMFLDERMQQLLAKVENLPVHEEEIHTDPADPAIVPLLDD